MSKFKIARYEIKPGSEAGVDATIREFATYVGTHLDDSSWVTYRETQSPRRFVSLIAADDDDAQDRHRAAPGTKVFVDALYPNVARHVEFTDYELVASSEAETRRVVESYFSAWTRKDLTAARALLSDDLDFQGSIDRFHRADDYIAALAGFTGALIEARPLRSVYAGREAFLLYDCVTATPAGTIRTAEHLTLERGRIREIRLTFDATELRKLMQR